MRFNTIVFVAAVSFTLPAAAQTADPAAITPKKEKKVCRRLDQTGSILGGRAICHTKAEWAQIDDANKRNTDRTLNDRSRPGTSSQF